MQTHASPARRRLRAVEAPVRHVLAAMLLLASLAATGCDRRMPLAPTAGATASHPTTEASRASAIAADDEGPLHLEGEIGPGARWSIDRPAEWNGELVLYLHGYTSPAAPVALPAFGPIRDALLARGFAVAASSYSENGYAVKQGIEQSHQLGQLFASRVAVPRRTLLFGQSLGGIIGLALAQTFPSHYDGGLLVCGVVGGTDDEVEYLGDVRVLFDVFYPGVLAGDLEHPPVITDFNAQVAGPVLQAIAQNPNGIGLIQRLARRPLPGATSTEVVTSLLTVLGFVLQGGADLLDRTNGHTYFDNADWWYTGPGLPAEVIADVNARVARYAATPDAQAYLDRYSEPSGPLETPLLTLHTSRDPVVPAFHEDLLAQVAAGPWLAQRRVERYGHVQFSVAELMASFDDLVGWVRGGPKPAS